MQSSGTPINFPLSAYTEFRRPTWASPLMSRRTKWRTCPASASSSPLSSIVRVPWRTRLILDLMHFSPVLTMLISWRMWLDSSPLQRCRLDGCWCLFNKYCIIPHHVPVHRLTDVSVIYQFKCLWYHRHIPALFLCRRTGDAASSRLSPTRQPLRSLLFSHSPPVFLQKLQNHLFHSSFPL